MTTFHAVVWMDHAEAHVLMFDKEHVEAQRIKARSHHTPRHGHVGADKDFFEQIAQALQGVREVLLIGPTNAKIEFRDFCKHNAHRGQGGGRCGDHRPPHRCPGGGHGASVLHEVRQHRGRSEQEVEPPAPLRVTPRVGGTGRAAKPAQRCPRMGTVALVAGHDGTRNIAAHRHPPVGFCYSVAMTAQTPPLRARSLFHFAFHVTDLDEARRFYGDVLGCTEGRSTDTWVDFDFFSHQISLHLGEPFKTTRTGQVGEHLVPMPHFGLVMQLPDWRSLAARLQTAGVAFVLPPQCRFEGQPGEQWTMFFCDPFGNPIEVKGFADLEGVYAH